MHHISVLLVAAALTLTAQTALAQECGEENNWCGWGPRVGAFATNTNFPWPPPGFSPDALIDLDTEPELAIEP